MNKEEANGLKLLCIRYSVKQEFPSFGKLNDSRN